MASERDNSSKSMLEVQCYDVFSLVSIILQAEETEIAKNIHQEK